MDEIWKDLEGREGIYQASNMGRVRSFKRGYEIILRPASNRKGYKMVAIDGKTKQVHRIVLETFKGKSPLQSNHIDGNPDNNRLDNLEYVSARENNTHNKNTTTGTYKCKGGKYSSTIRLNGKHYHLGMYETQDEAHEAYLSALKENGLENKYAKKKEANNV